MDNIDRIMKEAARLGFGVSYGKYQSACYSGSVESVSAPPKAKQQAKPSIICRHCGKPFVANHANQAYCSPECKYEARLARQDTWNKTKGCRKPKQQTLVCAECGADFKAFRYTQKYCCKECAKDGKRKTYARWRAAKKETADGISL